MARGKSVSGECCICGAYGPLTFEHVPPRSAFNDSPVLVSEFEQMLDRIPGERPKGRIEQRGSGAYTLCAKCNNDTGAWYAKGFTWWCRQGMELLIKTRGRPTLSYPWHIFPLHVIKQIMAMFCSVNGPGFVKANPELARFLLSRDRMYLDPKYSLYAYLNFEGAARRRNGITGLLELGRGTTVLSEISNPPFGYVLVLDGGRPDQRLVDLSFFARYPYSDFRTVYLSLPVLETHLWFPGDYRSTKEIEEQRLRNILEEHHLEKSQSPG